MFVLINVLSVACLIIALIILWLVKKEIRYNKELVNSLRQNAYRSSRTRELTLNVEQEIVVADETIVFPETSRFVGRDGIGIHWNHSPE